jgi:hypothetical protein
VVNAGSGSKQTVDITGIRTDSYLCITSSKDNGKYLVEDQTSDIETGIRELRNEKIKIKNDAIYDISGRKIYSLPYDSHSSFFHNSLFKRGIFIKDGRKIAY